MCGLTAWLEFLAPVAWRGALPVGSSSPEASRDAFAAALASDALARRGPDVAGLQNVSLGDGAAVLKLKATVLQLRGLEPTGQPIEACNGGWLLFNGEIYAVADEATSTSPDTSLWSSLQDEYATPIRRYAARLAPSSASAGASQPASSTLVEGEESDTAWLARQLTACEAAVDDASWETLATRIRPLLETLQGPFSLCIWAPRQQALLCARDKLGRRSLLMARNAAGDICVSSVPVQPLEAWTELPVTGLFVFDLSDVSQPQAHHVPWLSGAPFAQPWWWGATVLQASSSVERFAWILGESVRRRVLGVRGGVSSQPRVGVLFSGGLDSTVLAALVAEALPVDEHIELINVAFDSTAPDRLTALCSFVDLCARFGPRRFRMICVDVTDEDVREHESRIGQLLGPKHTHLDFNIAVALWFAVRGEGALCSPTYAQQSWWDKVLRDTGSLAAVELEERPRSKVPAASVDDVAAPKCHFCVLRSKPGCMYGACKLCCKKQQAACITSQESACPVHKIKGAAAEQPAQKQGVAELNPDNYLATASEARELFGLQTSRIRAACRVLLIGTGADELLGGYARHRTAREKRGAEGVRSEMLKDLERLWTRNLGRDDRIVSDHGREARHPFLDDDFLAFVGALPIDWLAFGPGGEQNSAPDKWMLRQAASQRGLSACARFKKRAIQFGSRIAKQSNVRHAGSNRGIRGDMAYTMQERDEE